MIMRQAPVDHESPMRIHSRDTDPGGTLEFHNSFIRYIGAICHCGRARVCAADCRATRFDEHLDTCEPSCIESTRFHASDRHNGPTRMKKALRQVRRLNPKAYDLVYLIVALHFSFDDAMAKLNADHVSRGQDELSPDDYAILWVSGASLLTAAF
jgi:hypothetical protein